MLKAGLAADPWEVEIDANRTAGLAANPWEVELDVLDTEDAAPGSPNGGDRQYGPCGG